MLALALLQRVEVADVVAPHYASKLAPMLLRTAQLRALPLAVQVRIILWALCFVLTRSKQTGYVDAFAFCIGLRPAFVPASSELAQLLRDACAIVETPDEQAPSTRVTTANRQQLNAALKLACLRLLTAALGRGVELLDESIYRAAVGVAFRALAMRQAPLVAEARALLTRLLTPTTMPKDLVQQGLKPLMTAVARHNTATVPVLRCFARVMHLVRRRRSIEYQDGFCF